MMQQQAYMPGERVPQAGIYRCDGSSGSCPHRIEVRGDTFPPFPEGCAGSGWILEQSGMANPTE